MAHIIHLKTYWDDRWNLTVIEKSIPFDIKRVYYIYDVQAGLSRWWHRHKKTIQAAVCLQGTCTFFVDNWLKKEEFVLDKPDMCLIIHPEDWHTMSFSDKAIVMVLASEYFNPDDYIQEWY